MFKKLTAIASVLVMANLTGCTSFTPTIVQTPKTLPRPTTTESSYAMQVTKEIKTTANALGCQDAVLWSDEAELADKIGFHPRRNVKAQMNQFRKEMRAYQSALREWERNGSKPGEKPKPPVSPLLNGASRSGALLAYVYPDLLDGRVNTKGWSNLGVGVALEVTNNLLSTKIDNNEDDPPANYLHMAMVLPKESQIDSHHFDGAPNLTDDEITYRNVGVFAAQRFVRLLTKSAVDMGYRPVGELQTEYLTWKDKPEWSYVWQPLENDVAGCPKVTEGMGREDVCRVEWAPYRKGGYVFQYTWRLNKEAVPNALGGDGKKTAWIAHFGYDILRDSPLFISKAKNEPWTLIDRTKLFTIAMGLQKYLKDGEFVYVPMCRVGEDWKPQRVLDKNGEHFFTVIVDR